MKTPVLVLEGFYFMFKYSSQSKADLVVSISFRQRDPDITAGTHHGSHGLYGEGMGVSEQRPSDCWAL